MSFRRRDRTIPPPLLHEPSGHPRAAERPRAVTAKIKPPYARRRPGPTKRSRAPYPPAMIESAPALSLMPSDIPDADPAGVRIGKNPSPRDVDAPGAIPLAVTSGRPAGEPKIMKDRSSALARYSRIGKDGRLHIRLPRFGDDARGLADGGPPTHLTNAVAEKILLALRRGNFRGPAAQWAGVWAETMHRWLARPEPRFVAFRELVMEAEASMEIKAVHDLTSSNDPRVTLAWLARRHPERWARAPSTAVNVNLNGREASGGASVAPLDLSQLPTADLLALQRIGRVLRGGDALVIDLPTSLPDALTKSIEEPLNLADRAEVDDAELDEVDADVPLLGS